MARVTKFTLGSIVLIVLLLAIIPVRLLEVKEARGGQRVFWALVYPGDTFSLSYIHSVENIPVSGLFAINEKYEIVIKETAFASFGPGLPILKKTDDYVIVEGKFLQRNINTVFQELTFFVHPFTDHLFTFKGRETPLSKRFRGSALIRIQIKKSNLLAYLPGIFTGSLWRP
ncbi:MAG: DUF1850 domain-containing protein [candidate division NC10 bacterium]|nr:DUF1850 domain-containing protein [candidate division NC10 bacterium]